MATTTATIRTTKPSFMRSPPFTPSPAQSVAITTDNPNVLCLAGPGSGKTRTVIERILRLIRDGQHPLGIVAITYTNRAAEEMVKRLGEVKIGFCGTLHSFMLTLIQSHRHVLGYRSRVSVLDDESRGDLIASILNAHRCMASKKAIEDEIAIGIPTLDSTPSKTELVAKDFYDTLIHTCTIDFDSILILGLEMLQRFPDIGVRIGDQKVEHLFVDEFQDCTDRDFQIITRLPITNRFLVGDSDQSIFGFRGGLVGFIVRLAMDDMWLKVMLEQNYRSRAEICEAAMRLIRHNKNRVDKATVSIRGQGGHVNPFPTMFTEGIERSAVLDMINKLHSGRGPLPAVPLTEIAVLVRTNALVDEFKQYLKDSGILVAERATPVIPEDFEKSKLLIGLVDNPDNDFIAHKFLTIELGEKTANEIQRKASEEFTTVLKQSRLFTPSVYPDLVSKLELAWKLLKRFCSQESLRLFEKQNEALVAARGKDYDLQDLLLAINREMFQDTVTDGVTVTTIHSAKGLEWQVVFLPAFEEEVIPGTRKDLDIEEERRVAFVGMTRAKDYLVITHCQGRTRKWTGEKIHRATPSRFLKELKA